VKKIALVVCALVAVSAQAGMRNGTWLNGTRMQGINLNGNNLDGPRHTTDESREHLGNGINLNGNQSQGQALGHKASASTGVKVQKATARNGKLFIRK